MNAISYRDVFELDADDVPSGVISVGDLVRTGRNHFPHFAVVAVDGDKAWIRNVQTGLDALMPLSRCRKVED